MATYRELHGKAVKTVTTNPSDDAAEGQIWFNSTDNTFKSAIVGAAWSSEDLYQLEDIYLDLLEHKQQEFKLLVLLLQVI